MPQLIDHIDAIARQKKRDVLYIVFSAIGRPRAMTNWDKHPSRKVIVQWLDEKGIPWQPCAGIANANRLDSYQGQVYIDIPFDRALPEYIELEAFLENPDGTMRLPGATFGYLPLEHAMKNAHHDEPGFWEQWAESF